MSWRPQDWKKVNEYYLEIDDEIFEAGADAMLEALRVEGKKQGMKLNIPDGIKLMANGQIYTLYKTEGQTSKVDIIIIPDEE